MGDGMLRGLGALAGTKTASMAVGFVATLLNVRLIAGTFGQDDFGAVSLIAGLTALIPFADLGLGVALTNMTVNARVRGSSSGLLAALSPTVWVLLGVGALGVGFGCVISVLGAWPAILGSPSLRLGDPNVYMIFYSLLTALWLASGVGYRLLAGLQRTNTLVALQGVTPVITTAMSFVLVAAGGAPVFLAFFPLIASLLTSIVAMIMSMRAIGIERRFPLPIARIGSKTWRRTFAVGLGGFWFSIGGLMMFAVDRLLVSNLAGARELAVYAIAAPLFAAAQSALGSVGTYLWPRYTALRMRGHLTTRRLRRDWSLMTILGVVMGLAVIAFYPLYAKLTTTGVAPRWLMPAFAVVIVLQATNLALSSALTTDRLLVMQGISLTVAFGAKVGLAFLIVPYYGAVGVVVSSALAIGLIHLPVLTQLVRRNLPRQEQRNS